MKTEWRIFGLVAVFLLLAAAVYAWWTQVEMNGIDWTGTVALILAGGLCLMCGGYFWLVSRRILLRPEDRDDAEIAEGAGELGFFSPGSYWPLGMGFATLAAGIGVVYWMWWLIAAGLAAVLITVSGLLFEYYTGSRRGAEH